MVGLVSGFREVDEAQPAFLKFILNSPLAH